MNLNESRARLYKATMVVVVPLVLATMALLMPNRPASQPVSAQVPTATPTLTPMATMTISAVTITPNATQSPYPTVTLVLPQDGTTATSVPMTIEATLVITPLPSSTP